MSSDEYFSKYDSLISESIERWHVPGVSIAVVDGDSIYSKAYGYARYPDEKVTPDTLFNAASMTKAFVSAAVSLLVDDEAYPDVQWTTPVSKLLREDFVLSDSQYTEVVTLEDILSHRSGLPDLDDACMGIYAKTPDTPKSVTRKLRHLPLTEPLRTKFQYSNIMYVVATHLVETLTGVWMGGFLKEKIWEPLEMKDTYFGLDDVKEHGSIDQLAKGYRWDDEKSTYAEVPWPVQPEGAGAGEMKSTAGDYAKSLRSMIHKTGPISEKGHEELVKPRTIVGDEPKPFHSPALYALGWEVETYHGETIIGHDGSTNGFACKMLYVPRLNWGMVIFGNTIDPNVAEDKICWTLIDDLLNIPEEKRFDWDKQGEEYDEESGCKTKEELYPKLPDTRIPLTLPLVLYAGSYKNDGYGILVVDCKDGKLAIDATDRTWRFTLSLEHVSGEFFIANLLDIDTFGKGAFKAQFRIGAEGSVGQFGVAFMEEMESEMIWFQRIEADET